MRFRLSGRRGNAGGRSRAFRDGLVVLQVAATLVLLVAAGLMLRTLANLNAIDLGFDANSLLTMQAPLMPKYAEAEHAASVLRAHHRRHPRAARRARSSIWLNASISVPGLHANLQHRGTPAAS